ncbi:MAG: hypothetical protein KC877_03905 [Candidatus Kaiserbacteria bacterium]|nr:hypothetical protein [Candidatus Kaiserbacteria bacterium]MCB9816381.1 hypothetical protein [Candidatus Nomurabacteria bacterium]
MTQQNFSDIATELWENGWAMFPIEQARVEQVKASFPDFVARRVRLDDVDQWHVQLSGESEADVGLVVRNGGNHDRKWFFHSNPALNAAIKLDKIKPQPDDYRFLVLHDSLRSYAAGLGAQIMDALDELYGLGAAASYRACLQQTMPYSTATLRSLYYPSGVEQTGAKVHVDRSLLTIHFGDEGGQLLACKGPGDTVHQAVSPPPGFALVFFGVKILWVSRGEKQPLWHLSTTQSGQDRLAHVHFGHVDILDYLVPDAKNAYCDFFARFQEIVQEPEYEWRPSLVA